MKGNYVKMESNRYLVGCNWMLLRSGPSVSGPIFAVGQVVRPKTDKEKVYRDSDSCLNLSFGVLLEYW